MANQPPIETLRDGALKATIWRNENDKGPLFRVNLIRTYKGADGQFRDADSFSGTELLRISRLSAKAYDRVLELTAEIKANALPS